MFISTSGTHTYTVRAQRSHLLHRYYWKRPILVPENGIYVDIELSISQIEVSMTSFRPILMLKIKSYYLVGFFILRVELKDCRILLNSPIRWPVEGFPPFPLAGWGPKRLFSTQLEGQTIPISPYFGQNTIFALLQKKSVKNEFLRKSRYFFSVIFIRFQTDGFP